MAMLFKVFTSETRRAGVSGELSDDSPSPAFPTPRTASLSLYGEGLPLKDALPPATLPFSRIDLSFCFSQFSFPFERMY